MVEPSSIYTVAITISDLFDFMIKTATGLKVVVQARTE